MFHRDPSLHAFDIVIGIRSDSVHALVVEVGGELAKPVVVFSVEEYIRAHDDTNTDESLHALKEALLSATLLLSQNGLGALAEYRHGAQVQGVAVVAGAPYGHAVTRYISLTK